MIWIQGWDKWPAKYYNYVQSWVEYNPTWKVIMWDEKHFLKEATEDNYKLLDIYNTFGNQWTFKGDFIKFYILKKYGGVYADMDAFCLKPLDIALRDIVDKECVRFATALCASYIANIFTSANPDLYCIVSSKNHPYWNILYDCILKTNKRCVSVAWGNEFIYLNSVKIAQSQNLNVDIFDTGKCIRFEKHATVETFCMHECEGSWLNGGGIGTKLVSFGRDSPAIDYIILFIILIIIYGWRNLRRKSICNKHEMCNNINDRDHTIANTGL